MSFQNVCNDIASSCIKSQAQCLSLYAVWKDGEDTGTAVSEKPLCHSGMSEVSMSQRKQLAVFIAGYKLCFLGQSTAQESSRLSREPES